MRALLLMTALLSMVALLMPVCMEMNSAPFDQNGSINGTRSNVVFIDDFESTALSWTHGGSGDEWELGSPNGSDPNDPGPSSAYSGGNVWGTDLNSTYDTGCDQWLQSPIIDLEDYSDATLDLWIWYDVTAMMSDTLTPLEDPPDMLALEMAVDPYSAWDTVAVFNHSSYQESTWINPSFDITGYVGHDIRLRLRLQDVSLDYTDNGAYVDDVRVQATPLPFVDVAVTGLSIAPVCEIEKALNLTISLSNKGLDPITNAQLHVSLEDSLGVLVKQGSFTVPIIQPLSKKEVYWNGDCDRYAILTINVEVTVPGDEDTTDNTASTTTRVVHFFYDSDMEMDSQTSKWTQEALKGNTLWHVKKSTAMAHSGAKSWWCANESSGKYDNGQDNRLLSPRIDLSKAKSANLLIWTNYSFEDATSAWDGGVVEISTDNGRSFSSITPKGGYDDTITMDGGNTLKGMHAFAHSSNGWRQVEFVLNSYAGNLINISFRMGSDLWDNNIGWFIDDVSVFGEAIAGNASEDFAPDPVSRLRVKSVGDENVTISWEVCPVSDFMHYNLYVERSNFTDVWGLTPADTLTNRTINHHVISDLTNGIRYYIALTAVDIAGNENRSVVTVSAVPSEAASLNHAPIAKMSCSSARKVNDLIYFYSRDSYDPDTNDAIVTFRWDFGDGASSEEEETSHRFQESGTYNVTLTVTDEHGLQGEDHLIIQINPADEDLMSNRFAPIMMVAALLILIAFIVIFFYFYKTRRTHKKVYAKRRAVTARILTEDDQDDDEVEFVPRAAVKFQREPHAKAHRMVQEEEFPIYIQECRTAKVVHEHPKHDQEKHLDHKKEHHHETRMTMIKCPCCCQIIKIKAPKDMLDTKEPIHIKCPICDQEGDISW